MRTGPSIAHMHYPVKNELFRRFLVNFCILDLLCSLDQGDLSRIKPTFIFIALAWRDGSSEIGNAMS